MYNTPKFDSINEQNTTFQTSTVTSPQNSQNFLHAVWPNRAKTRARTTKVTPIVIDKPNNQLSGNLGKSPPEVTPPSIGKKNNLIKSKIFPKTAENFNRKKVNNPLRKSTTLKVPRFNPKDYEEKFDIEDIIRQTNPTTRKRGASAIGISKNSEDSSSSSSDYEIENLEHPAELLSNPQSVKSPQGTQGSSEVTRSPDQLSKGSKKGSPVQIQLKSPNQIHSSTKVAEEKDGKEKISPIQRREPENYEEDQEDNVGYYEDVDFANISEDEYSPLVHQV